MHSIHEDNQAKQINTRPTVCLFDFRTILEKIHARFADHAYTKGLEFFVDFDKKLPEKLISEPHKIEQIFTTLTLYTLEKTANGHLLINVCLNMTDYDSVELKCLIEGRHTEAPPQKPSATSEANTHVQLSIIQTLIESLGGKLYRPNPKDSNTAFWFTLKCNYSDQEPSYNGYNLINQTLYFVDTGSLSKQIYIKLFDSIGFKVVSAENPDKIDTAISERDIFVYSIDTHYLSTGKLDKLLDAYSGKNIKKIAFISSYDKKLHQQLINLGFDDVVPKTINRIQLVSYFSTQTDRMTVKQQQGMYVETKNKQRPRVLIVDDNEINVKILLAYLKPLNVEALSAQNGETALQQLEKNLVDLIFMDIHMPIMNGYQTTEAIRALETPNAATPIIGITADGLQESIQKCLKSGMNHCLVKPIIHKDIEEILQTWVFQHNIESTQVTGKPDELTAMMLKELPGYKSRLKHALQLNNHSELFQIAHRIVGACAYCDIPILLKASLNLQTASKSLNQQFIEKSTQQLLETIDELLSKQPN